jgi:hypothetical protein
MENGRCGTCGEAARDGSKRCDWCWEVESRLAGYVRRAGRTGALEILRNLEGGGQMHTIKQFAKGEVR